MKCFLFILAVGWTLTALSVPADDSSGAVQPLLMHAGMGISPVPAGGPAPTGNQLIPGPGFPALRYEVLWTKSPFAVATAETNVTESPDYELVGFASNINGVSYASLIERQNQEHFLISTDQPTRGLTLTSITRSADGADTYANVLKDGQTITLKLEQTADEGVPGAPGANASMPGIITPQIAMPGSQSPFAARRPFYRIRRAPIQVPPPPAPAPQP